MKKIYLILILIFVYLILINFIDKVIPDIQPIFQSNDNENKIESGSFQEVGVSQSVSWLVIRHRFYGSIYESDRNSKLYLLYFLPLPLKSNGINFLYFHILFLIVVIYLAFKKNKKQNVKQEIIEEYNII